MPVILLSGGLDSLVLLAMECAAGRKPICVSVDYGQKHYCELVAAQRFVRQHNVESVFVELPYIFSGSALTGDGENSLLRFRHFYLQPMDGPTPQINRRAAVNYCLAHPQWRLSLQVQKFLGLK